MAARELQIERERTSLNVEQLTNFLDGNASWTKLRRETEVIVFSDPVFRHDDTCYRTTEEAYIRDIEKSVRYIEKYKELNLIENPMRKIYFRRAINAILPISLHETMFLANIEGQASKEQKEKWIGPTKRYEILGAYAQTEMGHGSYIRGLETTATYDPKAQEFILHNPTLTSLKWWPGGVGYTATHAVVVAKLIIQEKDYGIHHFIVPLRSLKDHTHLPGVKTGDIGPKFGYDGVDNGFLQLDSVRIPRENMLMAHARVDPDGTYTKPPHTRLSYATMIYVRSLIVDYASDNLSRAVTIATRYSVVRRQTPIKVGGPETHILDYTTQQYKVLPEIANSYALKMAAICMMRIYLTSKREMDTGNLTSLPVLHATSAGLKAFSTEMASRGIEACRLACGGMGYSLASGLPQLYMRVVPSQTYEGDNTVLYLQTARFLHKLYQQQVPQSQLSQDVTYLASDYQRRKIWAPQNPDQLLDAEAHVDAYRQHALCLVLKAHRITDVALARTNDQASAWNSASVAWVRAAKAHCHLSVVQMFLATLQSTKLSINNQHILKELYNLFALYGIAENAQEFQLDEYMSSQQVDMVQEQVYKLLHAIRKEAVPLVDAFDLRNELLCSVIGRYDGDVYSHLYQWALKSPRNKSTVHPAYHKHLRKLINPTLSAKL